MKTEEWHIIVAVSCFVVDVCFQFVRIRQSETDIKKWKWFSYFNCKTHFWIEVIHISRNRDRCRSEAFETISMIDSTIDDHPYHLFVIWGDLNCQLNSESPFDNLWDDLSSKHNFVYCSHRFGAPGYTYCHVKWPRQSESPTIWWRFLFKLPDHQRWSQSFWPLTNHNDHTAYCSIKWSGSSIIVCFSDGKMAKNPRFRQKRVCWKT